ncbi:MAG: hypothetical protein GY753_07520 [Gammaproteobacteria bacterium]|nr:hypothetical protein [Gammaproteobacteria bacterium]
MIGSKSSGQVSNKTLLLLQNLSVEVQLVCQLGEHTLGRIKGAVLKQTLSMLGSYPPPIWMDGGMSERASANRQSWLGRGG